VPTQFAPVIDEVAATGADNQQSVRAKPFWDSWYKKTRWQKIAKAQLAKEPLCRMCTANGLIEPASVADHVKPHRGDVNLFWLGELQSLCFHCHNSRKQSAELSNIRREHSLGHSLEVGSDGWPMDPKHPGNSLKVRPRAGRR